MQNMIINKYLFLILTTVYIFMYAVIGIQTIHTSQLEIIIQNNYNLFLPFGLLFIYAIVFRLYLWQKGRELLYIYQRIKAPLCMQICLASQIMVVTASFLLYGTKIDSIWLFSIKNFIIIFAFAGVYYGSFYCFRYFPIGLIISIGFFMIEITSSFGLAKILPYIQESWNTIVKLFLNMKYYIGVGILGWSAGIIANKRYSQYDI